MAASTSVATPQADQKLWSMDFVLNMLTGHFLFAAYTAMLPIVPLYALHRSGQEWQLGIIVGSFGVVGVLIRPLGGRWITAVGPKRMAVIGAVVMIIGTLLYIPALSVWWIIPVRMFQGIGIAIAPVATSTIVANLAPSSRRAEAMSYMGNAINVSFMYSADVSLARGAIRFVQWMHVRSLVGQCSSVRNGHSRWCRLRGYEASTSGRRGALLASFGDRIAPQCDSDSSESDSRAP